MSKLYTRTGDDGTTGLFSGERVGKDHPRIAAYGTIDELNACVGLAVTACDPARPVHERFIAILGAVQSRLFDLGADLATPTGAKHESKVERITPEHVSHAEAVIDEIDGANPPLRHFVLPGGTELAARLHLARTVCRRAERLMIALGRDESINDQAVIYVNRLSDLLFAMARRANADAGVPDVEWMARSASER
jgi:cob(I)alamin adenosyltransferase